MNVREKSMLAAILAGIAYPGMAFAPPAPISAAQRARWAAQQGYPQTGTGLRQGARLERQQAKGMLDYSASDRCIAAIKSRSAS